MNSRRETKINLSFTSPEIIRALKVAYPNDMLVQCLPSTIDARSSRVTAKVVGSCGLEIECIKATEQPSASRALVVAGDAA